MPLLLLRIVALLTLFGCQGVQAAVPVLRVLAWPGYAEPEVVARFEHDTGTRVELTIVDSDTSLWQKLSTDAGKQFDVFAVNTAELQRYIAAGLVQPVDPEHIPNTLRQLPRFRDVDAIPGLVHALAGHREVFAIPFTYAEMGLIYDRRLFPTPPDSISALWDPRWQGKVIAYNGGSHNFSLAAQELGNSSPFRLEPGQWPDAVEQLIALRRNVLSFYTRPGESVNLYLHHHAVLMFANYGLQQLHLLQAAGADVGYVIPREGALAWLDCWAISRGVRSRQLAHAWINHLLDDTASRLLVERQGLANTTADADENAGAARRVWLEPVEDVGRREALWARIYSGDRASRVLTP